MKTNSPILPKHQKGIQRRLAGFTVFSVILLAAVLLVFSQYEKLNNNSHAQTGFTQRQQYVNVASLGKTTPRLTTASVKVSAAPRE